MWIEISIKVRNSIRIPYMYAVLTAACLQEKYLTLLKVTILMFRFIIIVCDVVARIILLA